MKISSPFKTLLFAVLIVFGTAANAQENEKRLFYYENGMVERETYFNNRNEPAGVWKEYYENGQLRSEGRVQKGTFGKPVFQTGLWKTFYDNGQMQSEGNYQTGSQTGLWKYYHENGKLGAKGFYGGMGGDKQGVWEFFHSNGNRSQTGSLSDGRQDGEWKYYDEYGVIQTVMNYVMGPDRNPVPDGEIKHYDGKGNLVAVERYKMGVPVITE